jgi:GAF domain-containing protein
MRAFSRVDLLRGAGALEAGGDVEAVVLGVGGVDVGAVLGAAPGAVMAGVDPAVEPAGPEGLAVHAERTSAAAPAPTGTSRRLRSTGGDYRLQRLCAPDRQDPGLCQPLVAGEFGLRSYAGVPLTTHDGYNLGTLWVLDHQPREVTGDELEIRRAVREQR